MPLVSAVVILTEEKKDVWKMTATEIICEKNNLGWISN